MDKEKNALLEHAALCRRTAHQIERHRGPAERLSAMAAEYESRAARLDTQKATSGAPKRRDRRGNHR
jgi:hypothetical protein